MNHGNPLTPLAPFIILAVIAGGILFFYTVEHKEKAPDPPQPPAKEESFAKEITKKVIRKIVE